MKKESIYLDTSVPSALYDERVKERQETTIKFWESVLPNYHVSKTSKKQARQASKGHKQARASKGQIFIIDKSFMSDMILEW